MSAAAVISTFRYKGLFMDECEDDMGRNHKLHCCITSPQDIVDNTVETHKNADGPLLRICVQDPVLLVQDGLHCYHLSHGTF